ncbi:protein HipA [Asticcacaulis sp. AC460]|uniref:type II toxin-antitoxin system HipA family toxin n=1 Tax=Asticcacaulis sp. AC460 TaxID=1282360 RepID=UPI0003C41286|nr:type II toxin-antitoxin system HipA family toxin [Asticcacaulis sp. AC460]ESQ91471.1 protein HipA [Asticcacaulis sp. AC460]
MTFSPSNALNVFLDSGPERRRVGRLGLRDRRIRFEYDPDFVTTGLELSPYKLPLGLGIRTADDGFEGLFGLFNDSLPDGWGRLLLDRRARAQGIDHRTLTALDRLAFVGGDGMGALVYEPDLSEADRPSVVDLDSLAHDARAVLSGEAETVIDSLLALNGSSQGARPKITVGVSPDRHRISAQSGDGLEPWLIKFAAQGDPDDIGAVEYAYSLMARAAGLDMPPTHLFLTGKGGYFGIQRFDRQEGRRVHMHSLCGLLHADHRVPSLDYDMVLRVTAGLTRDMREMERAFALACFNVLAHNRDDHSKNFAFLMDAGGEWRLSPAYDLTFSAGPGGEQSTTVMGEGRAPGMVHLRRLAQKHGVKSAEVILEQVDTAVRRWRDFAAAAGVTDTMADLIGQRLQTP